MHLNNTTASGADSRAQITSTTLFQHPDGGSLWVSSNGRIGITEAWPGTDEPDCAALNIAPQGMRLLGLRLLTLSAELEGGTR
jgi:hypothetical protein